MLQVIRSYNPLMLSQIIYRKFNYWVPLSSTVISENALYISYSWIRVYYKQFWKEEKILYYYIKLKISYFNKLYHHEIHWLKLWENMICKLKERRILFEIKNTILSLKFGFSYIRKGNKIVEWYDLNFWWKWSYMRILKFFINRVLR